MNPSQTSRSGHIPHAVFGVGAVLLLVFAALLLMLLSGHALRTTGAALVVAAGVPAMIGFAILVAKKWRQARR